ATACKVAAVVCAAALTAGGTVEVNKMAHHSPPAKQRAEQAAAHAVTNPSPLQRRATFHNVAAAAPAPFALRVARAVTPPPRATRSRRPPSRSTRRPTPAHPTAAASTPSQAA